MRGLIQACRSAIGLRGQALAGLLADSKVTAPIKAIANASYDAADAMLAARAAQGGHSP